MPAEVRCEFFWVKFHLNKRKGEFFGEDFSTCQERTRHFRANIGANFGKKKIGNFVSNFTTCFFFETSFSRTAVLILCLTGNGRSRPS